MPKVLPSSLVESLRAVSLMVAAALLSGPASAADPAAGKATAEAVCAACHGGNGVSVSGEIPNLAGQKAKYLAGQLKAFRGGERKNAMMNAVAAQLDDTEIENVAAHFAGLPAGPGQETSALFPELVGDRVNFPKDFKDRYTRYTTISFEKRKQVRHYYASPEAVAAAKAGEVFPAGSLFFVEVFKAKLDADGKPVTGDDGHYLEADLAAYTAMEKQPGWGEAVPEILRNDDWRYSVFTPDGSHKPDVNEAACLACHQPLDSTDYVFSIDALKEVAAAN